MNFGRYVSIWAHESAGQQRCERAQCGVGAFFWLRSRSEGRVDSRPALVKANSSKFALKRDAGALTHNVSDVHHELQHVARRAAVIDLKKVCVLGTHVGTANAVALQSRGFNESARRRSGRISKDAARIGSPGLVLSSPTNDLRNSASSVVA